MGEKINNFLKLQNEHTSLPHSMFRKLYNLGYDDDFLVTYKEKIVIEQIILDLHPTSVRAITTICFWLKQYAEFTKNYDAYRNIENIDRSLLWIKARANIVPTYLSHEAYLNLLNDINRLETNALYYRTLFKAIYEGVYCDDMSVIINLRGSDIHDDIVSLHMDDGYSYAIKVSKDLISDLKKMAELNVWERKNRFGYFSLNIYGKYPDSCFKVERKKDDSKPTYFSYYNKLRKMSKEYLGYNLSPSHLFVSGIMYRIVLELKNNNIAIEDAFRHDNRNTTVSKIIAKELSRCEYNILPSAFREQVSGYIDIFKI